MPKNKRLLLALVIIMTSIGCDQTTKQIAHKKLPRWQKISYLDDTIRLQYAENAGAAFSIGADLPASTRWFIFNLGQGIFLLILLIYLIRNANQQFSQFLGFAFILGGGLGNFIDRIIRDGVVVDFLNLGIGNIRTAIFNVADVAITTGLVLLIIGMFFSNDEQEEPVDQTSGTLPEQPRKAADDAASPGEADGANR